MFDSLYENVNKIRQLPVEQQITELLEHTWKTIATAVISEKAANLYPGMCSLNDIARTELTADEVRSAVFENINIFEHTHSHAVDMWRDLTISEMDEYLTTVFPDKIYTI
jgi:hypothetical protein